MLSTSAIFFAVAIFGERIESNEARGQESGEVAGSFHNETGNQTRNESQELMATEQQSQNETHNESKKSCAQKPPNKVSFFLPLTELCQVQQEISLGLLLT